MKVLKFGGTSVGSVESMSSVKQIVESCHEPVIVVVSALGGITDRLIETARVAVVGGDGYESHFRAIVERHKTMVQQAVEPAKQLELLALIDPLLGELGNIFRGVSLIKDLSTKTLDTIVSYGERLSSLIVSRVIEGAVHYDARFFIKTSRQYGKHIVDFDETNKLVKRYFAELPRVAVVPGFIASDRITGDVTNLGRGGSDYTAAILATALGASQLEIWTDVDGFMTADPRVINTAYVIEHLSFTEAMELCNFGAKVIYPPTIYPVFHKNIPILIKNTFNPSAPGTLISADHSHVEGKAIKGISSINDTCLITLSGMGMVGVIGINSRIFNTLARSGVSVFLVSQASSENNTTFAVRNADADVAVRVLREEFKGEMAVGEISSIEAEKELATVAIVGENMKHTPGIAGKLFNVLGRNGINVIACAQGASETNISFVIARDSLRKALNVIHDSFFLSESQVLNLFVAGVGTVGRDLLKQICKQQQRLLETKALQLRLVGIANSRKCLFDREGIDIEHCIELLDREGTPSSPQRLKDEIIAMNIFNSVFVDCTASPDIAALYRSLLDLYRELKQTARKRDVKYLFETNVGAGLPIINTINNLINSGDKILTIEAVVSGTLNYIFNVVSAEVPLSRAVRMAQEAGYSEPDPRIDLCGQDVIRKLVILAREAGYRVEQSDVEKHLFIPESYFTGSLDDFWRAIPDYDATFEAYRRQVAERGRVLRFVATLDHGKVEVGLREVDSAHPFYHLEGSNNVISITTERYREYPMVIKGYGAGAEVTAAGVFADIIGIANIR